MVARTQQAIRDPKVAADAVLGLLKIDRPTEEQQVGALLVSTFMLKIIRFLSPKE